MMSQVMNHIESITYDNVNNINDLLFKVKLFSQITRIIIQKATEELNTENEKKKQFFMMIKTYTEKTQNKIYSISTELIESIVKQKIKNQCQKKKDITFFKSPNTLTIPLTN